MSNTASLSSFPAKIDNFSRVSDLDTQTLYAAHMYKQHINNGEYDAAKALLDSDTDLQKCAVNAEIINKHSDAIVALEKQSSDSKLRSVVITTTGTSSAYALSCSNYTGYSVGDTFTIQFHTDCASGATLNINSLGAIPIAYKHSTVKNTMIRKHDTYMVQYMEDAGDYVFNIIGQVTPEAKLSAETYANIDGAILYISSNGYMSGYLRMESGGGTKISKTDSGIIISSPDISPSLSEKQIGTIELYPDNNHNSTSKYNLCQKAFCITDTSVIASNSPGDICIPNTKWSNPDGLTSDVNLRRLISVEGVLIKSNNYAYPIGYNDGTISVNALYGMSAADISMMQLIIRYSGISQDDIKAVKGIIKYTTETA